MPPWTVTAGKLADGDKQTILSACERAVQWLNANQEASKDEFEHQQKELEGVCNPIMTKVYQGMGGAGGAAGGMPDLSGMGGMGGGASSAGPSAGASRPAPSAGPKVEEVD